MGKLYLFYTLWQDTTARSLGNDRAFGALFALYYAAAADDVITAAAS